MLWALLGNQSGYSRRVKKLEMLFGALRVPIDALAVAVALVLSYRLREGNVDLIPWVQLLDPAVSLPPFAVFLQSFVFHSILLFFAIALMLRLYAFYVTSSAWIEVGRGLLAAVVWLACVMAWYFLIRKELFYSRVLLLHSVFFIAVFVVFARAFLTLVYRLLLRAGYGVRAVVSFGSKGLTDHAMRTLEHDARYAFVGHARTLDDLHALNARQPIDLVLQTDAHPSSELTSQLIEKCRSEHIGYAFLPPVLADVPQQLSMERLGLLPMIRHTPTPLDGWGRVFKRIFDLVFSLVGLVILSPLFLVVAVLIVAESGFPVFYISKRIGAHGRKDIPIVKFRTMIKNADEKKAELLAQNQRKDGPLFKLKHDPRITFVGGFLRRWSIDELPQLFNVVAGQMSLVGPRPHLPEEVKLYAPHQRRVFAVWPGITGFAQVSGRSDLKFEDEVRLDLRYIEEWSLLLDLWIIWRTVFVVFSREGAD